MRAEILLGSDGKFGGLTLHEIKEGNVNRVYVLETYDGHFLETNLSKRSAGVCVSTQVGLRGQVSILRFVERRHRKKLDL